MSEREYYMAEERRGCIRKNESCSNSSALSSSSEYEESKRHISRHASVTKMKKCTKRAAVSTCMKRKSGLSGGSRVEKPRHLLRQVSGREHYQSHRRSLHSTPCEFSTPVNNGNTTLLSQFIDYIKSFYKESDVEKDDLKWPPTPSTVFINLACIDRKAVCVKSVEYTEITKAMVRDGNVDVIKATKGPIEFNEIAKGISISASKHTDSKQRRLILVEGAPGVGKSTFAGEFCRRWERGEIAQQYHLVLLLRLRDDRISKAKTLRDLIYHPLEGVPEAVSKELVHACDFNALIILEGFDELPDQCRNNQSIFSQLIAGELLPQATVLVTSRPWATHGIRCKYENHIHQHIEILGFTSNQITEYIERTLPQDKVCDLKAYLEEHPQIRMGMYIPLNSAIVVKVYQESEESGCGLPTTLTELYTALARTMLLRYICSHFDYQTSFVYETSSTCLELMKGIPAPPAVHKKFYELCKLAYRGIDCTGNHVQLIFTGLPPDFDGLGFMDSVTELYVAQGIVSSHNFLHLTFQEYFAALYILTLSPAEQLKHFMRHNEGKIKVVLRFLAGLSKLSCFSKKDVHHLLTLPPYNSSSPCSTQIDAAVSAELINWMFEAQNSDVITLLLENQTLEFSVTQYMLPLNYYSVGYCITHSHCQWVLSIERQINEEDVRMLVAEAVSTGKTCGKVVGLKGGNYGGLLISAEGLNMLFAEWKNILYLHELALRLPEVCDSITWPDLSALRVLALEICGDTSWGLDTLLPPSLESLTITAHGFVTAYNGDVSLVFKAIGDHITSATCLKELCLRMPVNFKNEFMNGSGLEAITAALAGNQSLFLERLELEWKCTFTNTAADFLAQLISNTSTLQYLRIWWCTFHVNKLLKIARAIHKNSTLERKSLEYLTCAVNGDNEANDLAQLLVEYPQPSEVMARYHMITKVSDAGAITIAQALHHNPTLRKLNLSNNNICNAGAVALAEALHRNSTLMELDLSNNRIDDTGAVALAEALCKNSSLKELCLDGNDGLGEKGTHQLVQALTTNKSITSMCGGGLRLPMRCECYATQCTQYHSLKDRITFTDQAVHNIDYAVKFQGYHDNMETVTHNNYQLQSENFVL